VQLLAPSDRRRSGGHGQNDGSGEVKMTESSKLNPFDFETDARKRQVFAYYDELIGKAVEIAVLYEGDEARRVLIQLIDKHLAFY
jgi:hypothetical protein